MPAVCRCQHCEQSASWWRWGYGMGRHKLWTINYLMAIWMLSDSVTRSQGPLSFHLSASITSQGYVCNSCKLKISQFSHGLHIHQTCYPLSTFGILWIDMYDSAFQFLPIYSNFAQPLKRSGTTFHRPQSIARPTQCEGDVGGRMRQMVAHQILGLFFF